MARLCHSGASTIPWVGRERGICFARRIMETSTAEFVKEWEGKVKNERMFEKSETYQPTQ